MFLISLTVLALAAAALFGALSWRLLREERRRSEARVAALAAVLDGDPARASAEAVAQPATLEEPEEKGVAVASLFEAERASAMTGRPVLKVAAGFGMAVIVIVLIALTGDDRRQPEVAAPTRQDAALELLSMRHERDGETLTVSGLVRNGTSAATGGVSAIILAFDREGSFVASGRSALDFVSLGPGEQSPFHVIVPQANEIGRYRVSFRTDAGVVRHLDRRNEPQARLAATQ